jgi:predicted transposase YbfD/YdcC
VPADPSSSIPAALTQLAHADPLRPADAPHLLAYLATIGDPRAGRGRRHPLVAILALAAAAVLAGARSMTAIAEWTHDTPQAVRAALGARRDAPDRWAVPAEATIRRALGRLDPDLLAEVIGAWLTDRDRPDRRLRAVAVDGKTLRGAKQPPDGRRVHLLAAMDHTSRAVLAQRQVNGAPGEVPGFQPLLAGLDLAGVVVTADALHTHADAAEFLVTAKHAHYLFTVKAKGAHAAGPLPAPGLAPGARAGPHPRPRPRPHRAAQPQGGLGRRVRVPHTAQVIQLTRKVADLGARRWRTVIVYAVTSLPHAQASPGRLADLIRGHWTIENGLHDVRDVTFAEDASQAGPGPARRS